MFDSPSIKAESSRVTDVGYYLLY